MWGYENTRYAYKSIPGGSFRMGLWSATIQPSVNTLRDLLLAFPVLRGGGEDLLQIPHDLGLRAAGDMQVLSDLPDILFFHLASSVC